MYFNKNIHITIIYKLYFVFGENKNTKLKKKTRTKLKTTNIMTKSIIYLLLYIKKRRYYQNYYITHFLLLTRVIKISFFVILKLLYKRTWVQILQRSICFYFFIY